MFMYIIKNDSTKIKEAHSGQLNAQIENNNLLKQFLNVIYK